MTRTLNYYFAAMSLLMRIPLILLTLVSILGCKDTKKNDEPKETRGELMERIEREKERKTTEQVYNSNL